MASLDYSATALRAPSAEAAPLATIVIPTFGDLPQLIDILAQVRAQTWPHLEVIVVDDASEPPVEPKLRAQGGDGTPLSVIRHGANQGPLAALHSGLMQARGKYVYLGSTNDPIEPHFIEAGVALLERYPAAGLCFSDSGTIDGWSGRRRQFPLYLSQEAVYLAPDAFARRMRPAPFHISSNTAIFRTTSLRQSGGYRPALALYADWFGIQLTALREGAVYIPEVLAYSREHPGQYSERRRWSRAERQRLAGLALAGVVEDYPELVPRLRQSRAASEFGFRVLAGLSRDRQCAAAVDPAVLWMALVRQIWHAIGRLAPRPIRRLCRRALMGYRRSPREGTLKSAAAD
jgi:GT2 family glycosyltransferase